MNRKQLEIVAAAKAKQEAAILVGVFGPLELLFRAALVPDWDTMVRVSMALLLGAGSVKVWTWGRKDELDVGINRTGGR